MDTTELRQLVKSKKFYIVDPDFFKFVDHDYNFAEPEKNLMSWSSGAVYFRHKKITYKAMMLSGNKISYGIWDYRCKYLKSYNKIGAPNFIGDKEDFVKFLLFVKQGFYDSVTKTAKWVVQKDLEIYGS